VSYRYIFPLIFFLLFLEAADGQNPLDDEGLTIAFTNGVFADVSASDATAATKVWAQEIKQKRGFGGPAEALSFDALESLKRSWNRKEIDLLVLTTWEYLTLKDLLALEPHFVPMRAESVQDETLLIVKKGSGIESISDLEGRDILILTDARGTLGQVWLELRVLEQGFPSIESCFHSVRETSKSSKTVLPVFFGQADACLVHSNGFETMSELNPQLKRDLLVLETSPAMVPSVLCIRPDYRFDLKEGLVEALLHLHEEPRGQQILMMFKVDQLTPFRDSYLDTASALLKEYKHRKSLTDKLVTTR
jgi:phosphonate transport system substrate-binding protein